MRAAAPEIWTALVNYNAKTKFILPSTAIFYEWVRDPERGGKIGAILIGGVAVILAAYWAGIPSGVLWAIGLVAFVVGLYATIKPFERDDTRKEKVFQALEEVCNRRLVGAA